MRRLPEPLRLQPGDYAVVTFGYFGSDRYILADTGGAGARAGTLDDGGGALTFLTNGYSTAAGALAYPTAALPPASDYAASAASFRYAAGSAVKSVTGPVTLPAAATLDVAAVDVRLSGGLVAGAGGLGLVTNASAAHGVTLRLGVAAGATNTLPGSAIGDRPDGTLGLVKEGAGLLELDGALGFDGGLRVAAGALRIDSPSALGGGDVSFGTGGQLLLQAGGELDRMLYVDNQAFANDRSTRLIAPPGQTLTLTRGIDIARAYEYGGFAIQPYSSGSEVTRVVANGARFGYLDLYLLGDGPEGTGQAEHFWTGVQGGLRKFAAGYDTLVSSRTTLATGCDFGANWFDIAWTNAVVCLTNNAIVRVYGQLRFVDGNASQLSLDGGTLYVSAFGVANANNQHLSRMPVLFNGTVLAALSSSDVFMNLSEASAAPLIRSGGAIFDTQGYEVAIRGKGFAQEPGSSGALVKQGAGVLKIATPMAYTGPTLVSNGTLRLDFALWSGTNAVENLLPPAAEISVSAGASLEAAGATNAAGAVIHRQTVAKIAGDGTSSVPVRVEQADLAANALQGSFVKTGPGTLAVACDGDGKALLDGAMTVQEGVFAVRGARANVTVTVPYASFESSPLLPSAPIGSMDKRGTSATGCPGWTFAPVSVTGMGGYQRNGSYFSGTAAAYTTEGVQTAFIKSNGWMEVSLTFPTNGTYALAFKYCSRFYSDNWFTNQLVRTRIDGVLKNEFNASSRVFEQHSAPLGYVAAGSHTLRLEGYSLYPAPSNDPCTLIDDIRITGVSDAGSAKAVSNEGLALRLLPGAQMDLDYAGALSVGVLEINGVRYRGGYYGAATHPEVFTGAGALHPKSGGTYLLMR